MPSPSYVSGSGISVKSHLDISYRDIWDALPQPLFTELYSRSAYVRTVHQNRLAMQFREKYLSAGPVSFLKIQEEFIDTYITEGITISQFLESAEKYMISEFRGNNGKMYRHQVSKYLLPYADAVLLIHLVFCLTPHYAAKENRVQKMQAEYSAREAALTDSEKKLLELVIQGRKNVEIANLLCMSVETVKKHKTALRKKLPSSFPRLRSASISPVS